MDKTMIESLASRIRYDILQSTNHAGSGHPTTCFSSVDLATVLFFKYLRFDSTHPENRNNDRVIVSKGHASALLYSLYAAAGVITREELMTYREFESVYEGHPTYRFPFCEAATGSLGQGLSIAAGMAWAMLRNVRTDERTDAKAFPTNRDETIAVANYYPEIPFYVPRVFVLLGDGECSEGSVWEAAAWASKRRLNNLIAIVDINRFGQSDVTPLEWDMETWRKRFESFGWGAIVIDGHDLAEIDAAYEKALVYKGGPVVILAKTIKGKGISSWEDKNGWHNKMLSDEDFKNALQQFAKDKDVTGVIAKPEKPEIIPQKADNKKEVDNQDIEQNVSIAAYPHISYRDPIATKTVFGKTLTLLGKETSNMVVLDGDVANSLSIEEFKSEIPDRFLEMYVAEQNMCGVAIGLSKRGYLPVVNTFAAFLSRAYDFIRMMPLSDATVVIHGSYGGVSLGKDGPSQMGLEDLGMMRAVFGSTVLYPSDPYQTEYLAREIIKVRGVSYIRTTREETPVIYTRQDTFPIGGSHVFRVKDAPKEVCTVCAAGITVHEALSAQATLAKETIFIRVVDCYSLKPIDGKTIQSAVKETGRLIIVEDHYPEGGLGDAVRSVVCGLSKQILHLAVTILPMSGKPRELLLYEGIDAESIVKAVKEIVVNR